MASLLEARDAAPPWPSWPAFGLRDDIRPALVEARAQRIPVAIVTLFHSEGGSPRGIGAQMAVGGGILTGHVSGGCIEGDVANHCRAVIASGAPQRLVYGRGGPWDLPLPCGGRIELLIEPVPAGDLALDALLGFTERREPCVWISDGVTRTCIGADKADVSIKGEAGASGAQVFRRYVPRTRLIVVGSDPTAMAIAGMAAAMDMEAVLVRPKGPPEPPPLPAVAYSRAMPAEAMGEIGVDRWTAIAACTHDHDLDHETLLAGLRSPASFVGALGSQRRRPERLEALRAEGLSEEELERVKTPIGLPIGARSPWEIAAATLAEIIAVERRGALA